MNVLCAAVLAFSLPAFHLFYEKNGTTIERPDDLTLKQCLELQKEYLPRAHAACGFRPGERELT